MNKVSYWSMLKKIQGLRLSQSIAILLKSKGYFTQSYCQSNPQFMS
jgi:hypothetical protein